MFCVECGFEITSERAKFCPKCGTRLEVISPPPISMEISPEISKNEVSEVSNPAPPEWKLSSNQSRSVSVSGSDRKTNEDLFELYYHLIEPVKATEQADLKIRENTHMLETVQEEYKTRRASQKDDERSIRFWWTGLGAKDKINELREELDLLGKKCAKLERIVTAENTQLADAIKQLLSAVEPGICYVPPAYRNSIALKFMVDDYNNCRVDSLKEAVQYYDKRHRYNQMDASLPQLCEIKYTTDIQSLSTTICNIKGNAAIASSCAAVASIISNSNLYH